MPSKANAEQVLRAALELSGAQRERLLAALTASEPAPSEYELLAAAVRLHGAVLPPYGRLLKTHKPRVAAVCAHLNAFLAHVQGARKRQAVADCLLRQVKERLIESGGFYLLPHILSVLESRDWSEMLDRAFPGYTTELIGAAACKELSTGSRYSKKMASSTKGEAQTWPAGTSTSAVRGAAPPTRAST